MRRLSELADESLKQPGSWRCLELVYRNEPHRLLDRFFLSSRAARGARNRLELLTTELCTIVRERARPDRPVRLISFGSGLGHEVLGCIECLGDSDAVTATCVDCDPDAIARGQELVAELGVNGRVRYVLGNVFRIDSLPGRHDVGVLSGLIDYFDFDTAVSVLAKVRQKLAPGGIVLIVNMRRHGLASAMRMLGNWDLVYREPEEVKALLAESGYRDIEVWLEAEQVFCVGKGRKWH